MHFQISKRSVFGRKLSKGPLRRVPFFVIALLTPVYLKFYSLAKISVYEDFFISSQLTFVTSLHELPREFKQCRRDHSKRAALHSWSNEFSRTVILADNDQICNELSYMNLRNTDCIVHDCIYANHTVPSVRCLLIQAERLVGDGGTVMFSNSDLIYWNTTVALQIAKHTFEDFLLVGKRLDTDFRKVCDSNLQLQHENGDMLLTSKPFTEKLVDNAVLHNEYGIDYFIFTKGSLPFHTMPDFLIGAWKWDNWLLDTVVRKTNLPLIDVTEVLQAVHLQTTKGTHYDRIGTEWNKDEYMRFYGLKDSMHLLNDPYPVGYGSIKYTPFLINESAMIAPKQCYSDLPMRKMIEC